MRLTDVVFGSEPGKLKILEFPNKNKKSKFNIPYIENDKTSQRYFFDKSIYSDRSINVRDFTESNNINNILSESNVYNDIYNSISSTMSILSTVYNYDGIDLKVDIKNRNLNFYKSEDDDKNYVSIAISCDKFKLIKYEMYENTKIIQTSKRPDYYTCVLDVNFDYSGASDMLIDSEDGYKFIGSMVLGSTENQNIIKVNMYFYKDGGIAMTIYPLDDIDPLAYLKYKEMVDDPKYYKTFKVSSYTGVCTDVVLVSNKYFKKIDEGEYAVPVLDNDSCDLVSTVLSYDPKIDSDESMVKSIVERKIRAITTIGCTLPKDFCKKYKILYLFSYDPETNESVCIKSN